MINIIHYLLGLVKGITFHKTVMNVAQQLLLGKLCQVTGHSVFSSVLSKPWSVLPLSIGTCPPFGLQ